MSDYGDQPSAYPTSGGYSPAHGYPPGNGFQGPPNGYGYGGGAPGGPMPLAHWIQRVAATIIDWLIVSWPLAIFLPLTSKYPDSNTVPGWLLGLLGVYMLYFMVVGLLLLARQGTTGQSVGKSVLKISVVREQDAQPIGAGMSIVRYLVHNVDAWICYIGFLFPLWDQKRQTLADKILHTVVIEGKPPRFR